MKIKARRSRRHIFLASPNAWMKKPGETSYQFVEKSARVVFETNPR